MPRVLAKHEPSHRRSGECEISAGYMLISTNTMAAHSNRRFSEPQLRCQCKQRLSSGEVIHLSFQNQNDWQTELLEDVLADYLDNHS